MICSRIWWMILLFVRMSSSKLTVEYSEPGKCKDRCGEFFPLPCSCDQKCLVYNNCCEDFDTECPHLKNTRPTYYTNLMQSYLKCVSDVLVIASCPSKIQGSRLVKIEALEHYQRQVDEILNPNLTITNHFIHTLINDAPVTDLSTDINFINMSVYDCHKGNGSAPLLWNTMFDQYKLYTTGKVVFVMKYGTSRKRVDEIPLCLGFSQRKISIGTCGDNSSSSEAISKCPTLLSFVADKENIYNNKYCAECNGQKNFSVLTLEGMKNFKFNLIVTLKNEIMTILCVRSVFPWQKVTCPIKQNIKNNSQIKNDDCNKLSSKNSTLSHEIFVINIAVPSTISPSIKTFLNQLAQFINCHLTETQNLGVIKNWKHSLVKQVQDYEGTFSVLEMYLNVYQEQLETLKDQNMMMYLLWLLQSLMTKLISKRKMNIQTNVNNSVHICLVISPERFAQCYKEKEYRCSVVTQSLNKYEAMALNEELSTCPFGPVMSSQSQKNVSVYMYLVFGIIVLMTMVEL